MIKSQFNYCPLVWMFCSRQPNNLINREHERGLRLTYRNGTNKEFQQILREKVNLQFIKKICESS